MARPQLPHAYIGLSDGGATCSSTGLWVQPRLLDTGVRQEASFAGARVRRLTFESASTFASRSGSSALARGRYYDLRSDTISPLPEEHGYRFPAGGWRIRELATGIITPSSTVSVAGKRHHTGALPGACSGIQYHDSAGVRERLRCSPLPDPGEGSWAVPAVCSPTTRPNGSVVCARLPCMAHIGC